MAQPLIVFSHGQDGEPWGTKILAMSEPARAAGYRLESVDYRGLEVEARVAKLSAFCKQQAERPVLVGSSMGGHVAAAVSMEVRARGLFLLAPAFFMPGFEEFTPVPADCPIAIVHGWHDDIVPVNNSIRFAREQSAALHVLDSDHRLTDSLEQIVDYLAQFLRQLAAPVARSI
ncbi:MAG TPA: alpha/beta fold hydrolase [Steroidobacteraceae bacterium]|nr:alpha/beta fold hydrolase [Steroidobacteraceae bacterium]